MNSMQSLFPYQSYKPSSWDRYYITDHSTISNNSSDQSNVSSGLAAGITIAIFFAVFIFTFGCRMYSEYVDRSGRSSSSSTRSTEPVISVSMARDFWICGVPRSPPPPYEIAILMPSILNDITPISSNTIQSSQRSS